MTRSLPDTHHPPRSSGPDPAHRLSVRVARTEAALDSLERTWNELLSHADSTVFQTFEWNRSWWAHYGNGGRELYCLTIDIDGKPGAIIPMFRERVAIMGALVAARLQFIGTPLSDYNDVIVRRGSEQAAIDAFADHLASVAGEWDVLDIDDIPEESCITRLLPEALLRHAIEVHVVPGTVCPRIELPDTYELFLRSLGPNTRYNIKRRKARLQERHKLEERVLRLETDEIARGVDEFIAVHGNRWKHLGFPSAYDDARNRAFLTEVARRFAHRGWLRIYLLSADGLTVAASIEFNYGNRIYMYQSNAYGPDEVMRNSPGLLIKLLAVERGLEEGMKVYDLLRGDEAYKYDQLKAVEKRNRMIRATSTAESRRARYLMFLAWAFSRKIRGRIPLEYHEFRRFTITKRPSLMTRVRYLLHRVPLLMKLGRRFALQFVFRRQASNSLRSHM